MRYLLLAITFLCSFVFSHLPVTKADDLFGLTESELVRIDTDDPSQVEIIGPTNLPANYNLPFALTYHRDLKTLFGIAWEDLGGQGFGQMALFEFDIATGQSEFKMLFGIFSLSGEHGSLSFVDSIDSLVISRANSGGNFISSSFFRISPEGIFLEFLADNGRDNDSSFYDRTRDLFYVLDPNDSDQLTMVDLSTGQNVDLGAAPDLVYGAYSESLDAIFAVGGGGTELVRIETTNGQAPICVKGLGLIGSDPIVGLAFVPELLIPGDVNCDGEVNLLDVEPFVDALTSGQYNSKADVNQDGVVDLLDVAPFVDLLAGG